MLKELGRQLDLRSTTASRRTFASRYGTIACQRYCLFAIECARVDGIIRCLYACAFVVVGSNGDGIR